MGARELGAKRFHTEGGHALLMGRAVADAAAPGIGAAARYTVRPHGLQTEAAGLAGAHAGNAPVVVVEAPGIDAAVANTDPRATVATINADVAGSPSLTPILVARECRDSAEMAAREAMEAMPAGRVPWRWRW